MRVSDLISMLKQLITNRTKYLFCGGRKAFSQRFYSLFTSQTHVRIDLELQTTAFYRSFYQIISRVNETFIGNIFLLYDLIIP